MLLIAILLLYIILLIIYVCYHSPYDYENYTANANISGQTDDTRAVESVTTRDSQPPNKSAILNEIKRKYASIGKVNKNIQGEFTEIESADSPQECMANAGVHIINNNKDRNEDTFLNNTWKYSIPDRKCYVGKATEVVEIENNNNFVSGCFLQSTSLRDNGCIRTDTREEDTATVKTVITRESQPPNKSAILDKVKRKYASIGKVNKNIRGEFTEIESADSPQECLANAVVHIINNNKDKGEDIFLNNTWKYSIPDRKCYVGKATEVVQIENNNNFVSGCLLQSTTLRDNGCIQSDTREEDTQMITNAEKQESIKNDEFFRKYYSSIDKNEETGFDTGNDKHLETVKAENEEDCYRQIYKLYQLDPTYNYYWTYNKNNNECKLYLKDNNNFNLKKNSELVSGCFHPNNKISLYCNNINNYYNMIDKSNRDIQLYSGNTNVIMKTDSAQECLLEIMNNIKSTNEETSKFMWKYDSKSKECSLLDNKTGDRYELMDSDNVITGCAFPNVKIGQNCVSNMIYNNPCTSLNRWTVIGKVQPLFSNGRGFTYSINNNNRRPSYASFDLNNPTDRVLSDVSNITIMLDIKVTSNLLNFFFCCNNSGRGTMLRLDTRRNNRSGFASTTSFNRWNAPILNFINKREMSETVSPNKWYTCKIQIKPNYMADLYIDGILCVKDYSIKSTEIGTRIAVHSDTIGQGEIDNIQIYRGLV